jgi:hypothetical protein
VATEIEFGRQFASHLPKIGRHQMSEMSNYVEEFNVLYAALVSGEIDEGEFRRTAIMSFGYTNDEISLIARRVRRVRLLPALVQLRGYEC